jgi:hypothetical protein
MSNTRRFSLEEDFMNWSTNDLLYGFLRSLSTARLDIDDDGKVIKTKSGNDKWREYLTVKEYKKNKKTIAGICGCSTKTIDRHIDKLFEKGLLDEGIEVITVNGKEYEYECFWFPYDEDGLYKIVDKDVIKYLVYTRNAHAIRIYLYLLNKYQWKKDSGDYIFTIQELKEALGYAATTKSCDELIKCVLASFKAEGIIAYEKFVDEVEISINDCKVIHVEKMKLKYVLETSDELPNF